MTERKWTLVCKKENEETYEMKVLGGTIYRYETWGGQHPTIAVASSMVFVPDQAAPNPKETTPPPLQEDEHRMLKAIYDDPSSGRLELATTLGFKTSNGDPNKKKVENMMNRLVKQKLVSIRMGRPVISADGIKTLKACAPRE